MTTLAARHGADVRRRFVRVRGRDVHYLRAGEGPPVILLHSALASACEQLPLLRRLASDHTVFAFDHPGMGDSDPLAKPDVRIADAADALRATLVSLQMPRCPVYGSHTGGAVALDLALRHPSRVSALIVDGPCMFSPREARLFRSPDYLTSMTVKDDGSHLITAWVKVRDHFIWFPWSKRTAGNRVSSSFPPLEVLHEMCLELLRAGDGYRGVYGAAFVDGRDAAAALTVPATFMAAADDPLFQHLDRLPTLRPNQRIGRYGPDSIAYLDETARVVRSYRVHAEAPPEVPVRRTAGAVARRYVDLRDGQILVRSSGEARRGRPLLLLHDGRASSRVFEPLLPILARHRAVYAPDLPDNGVSDPLAARRPEIADYAGAIAETVAAFDLESCDIYAVGAGAAVALELLASPTFANSRAVLEAPDFYPRSFARRLAREWVPPLTPESDGAHLNRLWLMLRDEYAFWPWFDKSPAAACAIDAPTDWQELHGRVTDILRSLPTYHRLTAAALRYDWRSAVRRAGSRSVSIAATPNEPRSPHAAAAARLAGLPGVAVLPPAADGKARHILQLLSN